MHPEDKTELQLNCISVKEIKLPLKGFAFCAEVAYFLSAQANVFIKNRNIPSLKNFLIEMINELQINAVGEIFIQLLF